MASLLTELEILLSKAKRDFDDRPDFDFIIPPSILDDFSENEPNKGDSRAPTPFIGPRLPNVQVQGPMTSEQALMEVMNNDDIILDSQMVKEINNPELKMLPTGEVAKVVRKPKRTSKKSGRDIIRSSGQFSRQNLIPNFKPKRKKSKYQIELGKNLKLLKKKHPRTKIQMLMKKAHKLTKKSLK